MDVAAAEDPTKPRKIRSDNEAREPMVMDANHSTIHRSVPEVGD
ncbi:MAG: hypothetical protein OJF51_001260 [Nitrospira sp.]|nr:MAG: hypothetical protein OJF51_001260 [Nitrospira sp.]